MGDFSYTAGADGALLLAPFRLVGVWFG